MYRQKNRTHCEDCNIELDVLNSVYAGIRRQSRCRKCHQKFQRDRYYKYKSNMTPERYKELFELQLGGCAICKQSPKEGKKLCIDHDHNNGVSGIRGLLCYNCNIAMGLLNENEDIIWNMLEYLKRTTWSKKERIA